MGPVRTDFDSSGTLEAVVSSAREKIKFSPGHER